MALKGKGKMPKIKTVNTKTKVEKPSSNNGDRGDNPYGGGAGDPTARKGGHRAK